MIIRISSWFQRPFEQQGCFYFTFENVDKDLPKKLEILSYDCLMVLPCNMRIEFVTHTIEVTTDIFDEMLHLHKETDLTISVSLKLAFAFRFEKPNSKKCYDSAV